MTSLVLADALVLPAEDAEVTRGSESTGPGEVDRETEERQFLRDHNPRDVLAHLGAARGSVLARLLNRQSHDLHRTVRRRAEVLRLAAVRPLERRDQRALSGDGEE